MDGYKDKVNTILLVATLVPTVTFAVGFARDGNHAKTQEVPSIYFL